MGQPDLGGILILPNDALSCIFEETVCATTNSLFHSLQTSDSEPFAFDYDTTNSTIRPDRVALTLSHVSRHFRALSLETPRLWSCVADFMGSPIRKLFLDRSKAVGLVVFLTNSSALLGGPGVGFLAEMIHAVRRWERLVVIIPDFYTATHLGFLELRKLSENSVSFESLTDLRLVFPHSSDHNNSYCLSDSRTRFYSEWKMPRLERLQASNVIPLGASMTSLTHLEIELIVELPVPLEEMETLWDSLAICVNLEELQLRITEWVDMDLGIHPKRTVTLSRLLRLKLTVLESKVAALSFVMKALQLPCIVDFQVNFYGSEDIDWREILTVHAWLQLLFPQSAGDFRLLQTLNLFVFTETLQEDKGVQLLVWLSQKFPELTHLALGGIPLGPAPRVLQSPFRCLKTLEITDYHHLSLQLLSDILRSLSAGDKNVLELVHLSEEDVDCEDFKGWIEQEKIQHGYSWSSHIYEKGRSSEELARLEETVQ